MVLRFFMLAVAFLLSCTDVERDDPDDPKSKYYNRGRVSSSSVVAAVPSSSSQFTLIRGPSVTYGGEDYKTVVIGSQTWMARNLNYEVPGSKCGNGRNLVDRDTETCETYGRLYNWATAMALDASCNSNSISCASQIKSKHRGICPSGWHIPSKVDWETLMKFVNPSCSDPRYPSCPAGAGTGVGTNLKAAGGWNTFGAAPKGTDDFGFSALPGGGSELYMCLNCDDHPSSFGDVGDKGHWWTASECEFTWNNSNDWPPIDHVEKAACRCSMGYNEEDLEMGPILKKEFLSVRCVQDSP